MGVQKRKLDSTRKAKRAKLALKPSQTLYINNLNDQILRELLKHNLYLLFSTYGDVIDIIIRPKMRGQAHVILESVASASSAKSSLDKRRFFSKELSINFARSKSHVVARTDGDLVGLDDNKKESDDANEDEVPGYN